LIEEKTLKLKLGKNALSAVVAAALVFFVAAPHAHAEDRSKCQHAVEKAEANLDKAIHDHGDHSPQADSRRRDLNAERQHCWDQYHQWWNGKEHRWETEQTWGNNPH
jgi:Ni/Co efflux regulator RcnB